MESILSTLVRPFLQPPKAVPQPSSIRQAALTEDGLTIALRRYARAHRPPIILLPGLGQNASALDLPVAGRSLAHMLWKQGFDVWLLNFRNHGQGNFQSGTSPDRNCTIDDLAICDLPAVTRQVTSLTGQPPFLVGHSMGGLVGLMYLMGLRHDPDRRVVVDEALQKRRGAETQGICLLGSPLPLSWPGLTAWGDFLYRGILGSNLAWWTSNTIQTLPWSSAVALPREVCRSIPLAGPLTVRSVRRFISALGCTPLATLLWASSNMDTDTVEAEIEHTLNDIPAGLLAQFCDWIREGTMRESTRGGAVEDPINYLDLLECIRVPLLMVVGREDKTVSAEVAYQSFQRICAPDKQFILLDGFGHNDLRVGKRAAQGLWPLLSAWLTARAAGLGSLDQVGLLG